RKIRRERRRLREFHFYVGSGFQIDLRLRKDRKKQLVTQQKRVRIQMERRQVFKSAADAPLRRVSAANALDDSVLDAFSSIINELHSSVDFDYITAGRQEAKKNNLKCGCLVPHPK